MMPRLSPRKFALFHQQARQLVTAEDATAYRANNHVFHNMICDGAHNATLTSMTSDLRIRLLVRSIL